MPDYFGIVVVPVLLVVLVAFLVLFTVVAVAFGNRRPFDLALSSLPWPSLVQCLIKRRAAL